MHKVPCLKNKDHPFTQVSNAFINDNRLSLKSKALLIFLISKPDSWFFNYSDILNSCSDGLSSIKSSIRELISFGYISLHKFRNLNKTFRHFHYTIYETPVKTTSEPLVDFPLMEKPLVDKPLMEKPLVDKPLLANNKNKKHEDKKTTTSSTKVVNTTLDVDSPVYLKKKHECLALMDSLNMINSPSLIKKYGLDAVFRYATLVKNSNSDIPNPTGYMVRGIRAKWLDQKLAKKKPKPVRQDGICLTCKIPFFYMDYKQTQKYCPDCRGKKN